MRNVLGHLFRCDAVNMVSQFRGGPVAIRESFEDFQTFRTQFEVPEIVVVERFDIHCDFVKPVHANVFHSVLPFRGQGPRSVYVLQECTHFSSPMFVTRQRVMRPKTMQRHSILEPGVRGVAWNGVLSLEGLLQPKETL